MSANFEKAMDKLDDHIRKDNLKSSHQRAEILRVFYNSKKHLTIEELYEICRLSIPNIGIATVYRALKLFCKIGICKETNIDNGLTRYEITDDNMHHDHLICTKCGTFVEIYSEEIEEIQEKITRKRGFVLLNHRLNLYGLCPDCQEKK